MVRSLIRSMAPAFVEPAVPAGGQPNSPTEHFPYFPGLPRFECRSVLAFPLNGGFNGKVHLSGKPSPAQKAPHGGTGRVPTQGAFETPGRGRGERACSEEG